MTLFYSTNYLKPKNKRLKRLFLIPTLKLYIVLNIEIENTQKLKIKDKRANWKGLSWYCRMLKLYKSSYNP